jgi:plastocyanin
MLARHTDAAQSELPGEPYYPRRGGEALGGGKSRKGIAALSLAAGLIWGTSGVADAVTVGVRAISSGGSFVWSPKARSIARGSTIRWRAVNGSHNVRSRGVNWTYFRQLPLGTSVARPFNRRGTFRYYCTIHGRIANGVCTGMCGRIVVS